MADTDNAALPLAEEFLTIDKEDVLTGRVRVSTTTHEKQELAAISLDRESVEVTRVPINRVVDTPPVMRTAGDVTIIPVLEETAVVEKRLVLVEEIHIRRLVTTNETEVAVTLRKQQASIERQTIPIPRQTGEDLK